MKCAAGVGMHVDMTAYVSSYTYTTERVLSRPLLHS